MSIKTISKIIIAYTLLLFSVHCYADDEEYAIPDELYVIFEESGFDDVELDESMIKGSSLIIIFSDFNLKYNRYLNAVRAVCSEVQKDKDFLNDYEIDEIVAQNLMESVQAVFKDASKNCLLMPKDNNKNFIDDHTIMVKLK
ncbi:MULTISPECIES: hypothetical protein [Pectobacterium]|uniref:hypothetical protein n=1 Tax=Pectobacterium TaxID=122277 RepID=UPI0004E73566|nr:MULTISPECIES: hypothetical protein [Pectobacterium]KFF61422.1 hypothetical protein IV99_19220 [Pectobacterium brasiliense]MCE9732249.1 hypothetical protein [Pectobacterium sp. IFB5596]